MTVCSRDKKLQNIYINKKEAWGVNWFLLSFGYSLPPSRLPMACAPGGPLYSQEQTKKGAVSNNFDSILRCQRG
ncbi:hypothetical protein BEI59_13595 [Eisenbergiella tayi]|uniref:Uncharacterized protein n=1 Tax=Eisenbergiella tayi TaxID=1432052 RepID=A0A1E3UHD1_9FIRM|nr:hypothetical protein BEI62_15140 [Eisenbergiella tayi]ODR47190.1 hypothetical protein BEI64_31360 [Eisenbergiella tayi]ODR51294.1 hypothetical protein BEI59_13595 [Eisenbergiella tayi]ODR54436.1 hypothetical protein BEI63_15825 [Eisenbergiella tayi]